MSESDNRQAVIDKAFELGLEVVYGNARTLQIDIDSKEQYEHFRAMIRKFQHDRKFESHVIDIVNVTARKSAKRGNMHIYVHLAREISHPVERYLLQSWLGSDPVREVLNVMDWRIAMSLNRFDPKQCECFFIENPKYKAQLLDL